MARYSNLLAMIIISTLFTGCSTFYNIASEDSQGNYDFRQAKWGYTQERIMILEQGKRVYFREPDQLIYKSKIGGIPVFLVYSFRDNKLRSAGYMTQKPSRNAKNFVKNYVEKHGIPNYELTDGMMWQLPRSIVYLNGYSSHARARNSPYEKSSGVLEFILKEEKDDDDLIARWDGVLTYIDRNFYNELAEIEFPLMELSYYEKRLFGILKRRSSLRVRTQTGDTVIVPLQEDVKR